MKERCSAGSIYFVYLNARDPEGSAQLFHVFAAAFELHAPLTLAASPSPYQGAHGEEEKEIQQKSNQMKAIF